MPGKLYVVGTPIGNLGDFSPRAIETLKNVDFLAVEDKENKLTVFLPSTAGIVVYQWSQELKKEKVSVPSSSFEKNQEIFFPSVFHHPYFVRLCQVLTRVSLKHELKKDSHK